jgi:hypothetical protein
MSRRSRTTAKLSRAARYGCIRRSGLLTHLLNGLISVTVELPSF